MNRMYDNLSKIIASGKRDTTVWRKSLMDHVCTPDARSVPAAESISRNFYSSTLNKPARWTYKLFTKFSTLDLQKGNCTSLIHLEATISIIVNSY